MKDVDARIRDMEESNRIINKKLEALSSELLAERAKTQQALASVDQFSKHSYIEMLRRYENLRTEVLRCDEADGLNGSALCRLADLAHKIRKEDDETTWII
jgi:hypothetical protein